MSTVGGQPNIYYRQDRETDRDMALNIQPPPQHQQLNERRGQQLAPLQTNLSRPTARPVPANRPRPSEHPSVNGEITDKVPLQAKRQSSKSSLRSLFGRDKSARCKHAHDKLSEIEEVNQSTASVNRPPPPPSLAPSTKHSAVDASLSPGFCATPTTAVTSPMTSTAEPQARNKDTTPSKGGGKKPSAREFGWKPPPLFQAYPQAKKHGTLPAPALSADAILRVHAEPRGNAPRDEENVGVLSQQKPEQPEANVLRRKREDRDRKHMRTVSQTISKADWTRKIYLITTSGYILQYSGDGKYDRLPEKVLLLGPRSVAFVSDAIPGKHWVLQVSQAPESDGAPHPAPEATVTQHKPLFVRLGFHRSYTRRLTQSFLLVFDDPDEMSSWLLAVRAEIEARGGKKYVSERVFDDGMEQQLRPKMSVRNLVKRDPNRFSNTYLQPQPEDHTSDSASQAGSAALSWRSSFASNNRHSFVSATQTDVTIPHVAGGSSTNGGSSGRYYAAAPAAGGLTASSSSREASSSPAIPSNSLASSTTPPSQPVQAQPPLCEATQSPVLSPPRERLSMYMPTDPLQTQPIDETPPHLRAPSTDTDPFVRSTSAPAPNFSVPSFSKRFTSRPSMIQLPPLQVSPRPSRGHENEHEDGFDVNDHIASFPSPPQSPNRSLSRMSRTDDSVSGSGDNYSGFVPSSRQSSLRMKPLRMNSQDSLASEWQYQQAQQQGYGYGYERKTAIPTAARPPRGCISTHHSVASTPRPSRPTSIISSTNNNNYDYPPDAHLPTSPPQTAAPTPRSHSHTTSTHTANSTHSTQRSTRPHHLPRTRTSTLNPTNNSTYSPMPPPTITTNLAKCKSMAGLTIGPPRAPPPNCPLPKIPSPGVHGRTESDEAEGDAAGVGSMGDIASPPMSPRSPPPVRVVSEWERERLGAHAAANHANAGGGGARSRFSLRSVSARYASGGSNGSGYVYGVGNVI